MKLCECGCCIEVKKNNQYVRGHNRKNKHLTEESKQKLRKPFSEEHKRKLSESHKGKKTWNTGKIGCWSEETKRKMSKTKTGKKLSEETKKKLSKIKKGKPSWNKGKKLGKEWSDRVSKNFLGKKHTSEYKKRMRIHVLEKIQKQVLNGEPLTPCIGQNERIFLNEVENIFQLKVYRQFSICGYFIDGYIPELKLAFEFDEIVNHKNQEKDIERQQEIEKTINCSFFRVTDLEWKNNKQKIIDQVWRIKNGIKQQ